MSWQRVRGHDVLVQAFQRVLQRGRLAHAYLFCGPAGVGKKLFAVELAKTLLCESGPRPLDACDHCPACLQVEAGTHPDFFSIRKPEDVHEFPIDLMREVCQNFALKPARGHGKVVILDDVDDLNEESANCFLKTLEEPPPGAVILLIGSSPDRQLPTIVSRCQVVPFGRLPDAEVAQLLRANGEVDAGLLPQLLRVGEGSPGQARALSDPGLWEFRRTLLRSLVTPKVDSAALAKAWVEFVEEAGKESSLQRQRAALCLGLLIAFFQDALRWKLSPNQSFALDADARKAVESAGQRLDEEQLMVLLDRCLESEMQIDRRVQLVLILEALSDAMGRKIG